MKIDGWYDKFEICHAEARQSEPDSHNSRQACKPFAENKSCATLRKSNLKKTQISRAETKRHQLYDVTRFVKIGAFMTRARVIFLGESNSLATKTRNLPPQVKNIVCGDGLGLVAAL
ncbi:MAG: hypothetical protein B6D41_09660 [Chloroflexi bacterium UTCFX4]|jgi:hypothetical protein|nr:MAG: hypothetical protein B6D41_09660 [Chloroflexi bacterium UTCFX4]